MGTSAQILLHPQNSLVPSSVRWKGTSGVAQGDPEDPLKACCPGWEPRVSHVAWLDDAGSHLWAWGTFLGGCELRGMGLQVGLRGRQSGKARRLVHFPD